MLATNALKSAILSNINADRLGVSMSRKIRFVRNFYRWIYNLDAIWEQEKRQTCHFLHRIHQYGLPIQCRYGLHVLEHALAHPPLSVFKYLKSITAGTTWAPVNRVSVTMRSGRSNRFALVVAPLKSTVGVSHFSSHFLNIFAIPQMSRYPSL